MTTATHRINEFTKRQVYYRYNYTAKLTAINGKWHYVIYAWLPLSEKPIKIDGGRYNGEDPYILLELAEKIFGKLKAGKVKLTMDMVRGKSNNKNTRMSVEVLN